MVQDLTVSKVLICKPSPGFGGMHDQTFIICTYLSL